MQKPADRISIDFISVHDLPPVEFVHLAADLGCRHLSTGLAPMMAGNPHNYPLWSLREDAALRADVRAAAAERDVSISLGEGFLVREGGDVRDFAADLDTFRDLGCTRVNTLGIDPDIARSVEQFAILAEMAAARDMAVTLEFLPGMGVGDLAGAAAAVRSVNRPNFRLLIDVMHLVRSGSGPADLAALDPELIGYVQLCDVPLVSKTGDYGAEARDNRLAPGEGELPLAELLAAAPRGVIVGLEVPMLDKAAAGIGPMERLAGCVATTRALLEAVAA